MTPVLNADKVCVIGLGYIGLPTASLLATRGFEVVGVDVNSRVVDTINRGDIHITEPGLDVLVQAAVQSGKLTATTQPVKASVYVIAVPTPFRENHQPDLSYVESAVEAMAPVVHKGSLVVLESTSPVGTTELICKMLSERRKDLKIPGDVFVAHCPERVLPGQILKELVDNDRIVGGVDAASAQRARDFYKGFVQGAILTTDARTAEMVKLSENAFRDVNIAYANELSLVCEKLGIDVWQLIELANRHPRVQILQPGPGVGGHCIAVDPWFIVASCPEETPLIRAARRVNDSKPTHVVNRVLSLCETRPGARVACLGLAYKANIDDLRESPAVEIAEHLASKLQNDLWVVEPHVTELPASLREKRVKQVSLEQALTAADVLVLLVDHADFKQISLAQLSGKDFVDTRGVWRK